MHDLILADRMLEVHRVLLDAACYRVEMREGSWDSFLGRPPHDEVRYQPDTGIGIEFVLDSSLA